MLKDFLTMCFDVLNMFLAGLITVQQQICFVPVILMIHFFERWNLKVWILAFLIVFITSACNGYFSQKIRELEAEIDELKKGSKSPLQVG